MLKLDDSFTVWKLSKVGNNVPSAASGLKHEFRRDADGTAENPHNVQQACGSLI